MNVVATTTETSGRRHHNSAGRRDHGLGLGHGFGLGRCFVRNHGSDRAQVRTPNRLLDPTDGAVAVELVTVDRLNELIFS